MDTQECWKIDVDHSTLRFTLRHKLLGEIAGQFRCWGGHVQIDPQTPRNAAVRIWVELSSIDTGSPSRDDEILRTELFDQREEPALEFDGERFESDASDHLSLVGWIGLHAFRQKVSVTVEDYALKAGAPGAPRFACMARVSVDRKALGLCKKRGMEHWLNDRLLSDTIDITAHIEATLESSVSISPSLALGVFRAWPGAQRRKPSPNASGAAHVLAPTPDRRSASVLDRRGTSLALR